MTFNRNLGNISLRYEHYARLIYVQFPYCNQMLILTNIQDAAKKIKFETAASVSSLDVLLILLNDLQLVLFYAQ